MQAHTLAQETEQPAAKADMKDVGEAFFVLLVLFGTFAFVIWWAKRNAKRNRGADGGDRADNGGTKE